MLGPSHPDTHARCAVMMIRPYTPRDSARSAQLTGVRDQRALPCTPPEGNYTVYLSIAQKNCTHTSLNPAGFEPRITHVSKLATVLLPPLAQAVRRGAREHHAHGVHPPTPPPPGCPARRTHAHQERARVDEPLCLASTSANCLQIAKTGVRARSGSRSFS